MAWTLVITYGTSYRMNTPHRTELCTDDHGAHAATLFGPGLATVCS